MSRRCVDFAPPEQQEDDGFAVLAEVDPIPRPERQPRLPHARADALVIAEIAQLEPEHTCLNPRSDGDIEVLRHSRNGFRPAAVRYLRTVSTRLDLG